MAPSLADDLSPISGLDTFRIDDQSVFFGRNDLIAQMVEQAQCEPFSAAIVGPSGSGKSSVAQAGLLPRLRDEAIDGSHTWRYYPPIVPGANPQASCPRYLAYRCRSGRLVGTSSGPFRARSDVSGQFD